MAIPLEVFLIGAIILGVVVFYFIFRSEYRNQGRQEERADSALNHVEDINKVLKQRRKDEKDIASMSIDDKLNKL